MNRFMHQARQALLLFVLLTSGCMGSALAAGVVVPGDGVMHLEDGEMGWLHDPSGTLTLADVRRADAAGTFMPLYGSLSRGYTNDVHWLRLRVNNAGHDARYFLEVMPPFLDDLRLYEVPANGQVRRHLAGDRWKVSQRDFRLPSPLFRLDLPAGETTLYLRVQTTSSTVVLATFYDAPSYQQRLTSQGIAYGIYIGVLGLVLLLNLINWRLLRDRIFALYCSYLVMQLVYFAASYGIVAQYFYPELPVVGDRLVGIGLGGMVITGLLFFQRLLDIDRRSATGTWVVFQVSRVIAALLIVAVFTDYYVHAAALMQLCLLASGLSVVPQAYRLRKGTAEQRIAAGAFLLFMMPVAFGALAFAGVIGASTNTLFAGQIANVLHIWLLHFAIARRVREADLAREESLRDAEVARVAAEQERQRNAEQSRLLSMITHEVRTPVAVIRSAVQSLRLVDPQAGPERVTRYERIDRSARRMNMLLELVAAADRLRDLQDGAVQRTDLRVLTLRTLEDIDPDQQARITVLDALPGLYVNANPEMLQVALLNLLDNALKYSPPGSPVVVRIEAAAGGRVRWSADDRGPGIPAADRAVLFDKYWRGGERQGVPGLGLGLYIVRGIVEGAGGTVTLDDLPGGGSRFACTFPAA